MLAVSAVQPRGDVGIRRAAGDARAARARREDVVRDRHRARGRSRRAAQLRAARAMDVARSPAPRPRVRSARPLSRG